MRSVCQSLNLLTNAIGTVLTIPLVLLVNINKNNEWLPVNLDTGHLVLYFLVLVVIMIGNLIYFYYVTANYEYRTEKQLIALNKEAEKE